MNTEKTSDEIQKPLLRVGDVMRSDLAEKECIDCNKKCFVIPVSPPDDPDSLLKTTGCYVSPCDDGHCFILCDDCCEVLYKEGRLGYSGDGDAFMVR